MKQPKRAAPPPRPHMSTSAPVVRLLKLLEGAIYAPQWAPVIRLLLLVSILEAPLITVILSTGAPSIVTSVVSGAVGVLVGRGRHRRSQDPL